MAVTLKDILNARPFSHLYFGTKPMSAIDGFIYNFLAMGVIFPWVYIWGPAAFPGANLAQGLFLTLIIQAPICISYIFLGHIIPGDGGDYLYQERAFGRFGSVVVMSGFVIWILQWIAISGWLFSTLGLAPLFLSLGAILHNSRFTILAVVTQSHGGVMIVSLLLSAITALVLTKGLRLFSVIQRFLFVFTLAGIFAIIIVFWQPASMLDARLTEFVSSLIQQIGLDIPINKAAGFTKFLPGDAYSHGFLVTAPVNLLSTLGIVPIAWTSLQWCTYSVEQNEQIDGARSIRNQVLMILGSAVLVTVLLVIVAYGEQRGFGAEFIRASSGAYWSKSASPITVYFLTKVFQPFPSVLAMAASGSILVCAIIAIAFMANAFQVTCNCFIGVSRIMLQMAKVGDLALFSSRLNTSESKTKRTYWIYFWASTPIILAYGLIPEWTNYTLGVTFACGYVFMFSCGAAVKLVTIRLKQHGHLGNLGILRVVQACSYCGTVAAAIMVGAYVFVPQLGLQGITPFTVVIGVLLFSAGIIFLSRYLSGKTLRARKRNQLESSHPI